MFKKRILTDSDLRIIESHSKKNFSEAVHDSDNVRIDYHGDIGMKTGKPDDKT